MIGDEVEQVDDQARAWIDKSPRCKDVRDVRSLRAVLVIAYRAGFAAGLGHARKVFMAPSDTETMQPDKYTTGNFEGFVEGEK